MFVNECDLSPRREGNNVVTLSWHNSVVAWYVWFDWCGEARIEHRILDDKLIFWVINFKKHRLPLTKDPFGIQIHPEVFLVYFCGSSHTFSAGYWIPKKTTRKQLIRRFLFVFLAISGLHQSFKVQESRVDKKVVSFHGDLRVVPSWPRTLVQG